MLFPLHSFFVLFCGVLSSWVLLHCVFVRSLFTQHGAVFYSIFARPLFEQEKEGERSGSCVFFRHFHSKTSHASQKKNISTLCEKSEDSFRLTDDCKSTLCVDMLKARNLFSSLLF